MLSSRANLNIVAGRNVRGRVTLFLKDVDVWDAFEIILAANNLAYEKDGDIINVMTERDYEQLYGEKYYDKKSLQIFRLEYAKAADISKSLNQAKSKIGKVIVDDGSNTIAVIDSARAIVQMEKMIAEMDAPTETKIFSLNYAKAEDIKTKISEILTKGFGTIQVDERTNKAVITDLSKKMPEISNVISEMDEKHKEVLIEAKIVQISLNDQYRYGIDWNILFTKPQDIEDGENIDEYNQADINFGEILGTASNFVTGTGAGNYVTGGGLALANIATNKISAMVEALQTLGRVNVISSPRITVLNNEEAKVLVGTNQPYIETTTVTDSTDHVRDEETIKWVDVGIELTVTPTINKDGFVTMKIKPKISSADTWLGETSARNRVPIVTTSESETTVMVKDGTSIVIAGLIEDRDEESENKIPFLGDIPIIGYFFKSKSVGSTTSPEKKELVIFLTPYIVHGTETFPESENVWYAEKLTQKELLDQQISLAVEGLKERRSIVVEELPSPPEEEEITTTRLAEDIDWFGDLPEKLKTAGAPEGEAEEEEPRETIEGEEVAKEIEMPAFLMSPSISAYYSYYANLRNRIFWFARDNYPKDLKGKAADVLLRFILTKDGVLKEEPKVINEVDNELALAAKNAVEKAAPFPPFPNRMDKSEQSFKVTITYQ
jgi:general secretion pathway protein D